MKLKDKKITILQKAYTMDATGNRVTDYVPLASSVWAYFRQLSMKELYGTLTQVEEQVLFQIGYRDDVTTDCVVAFRGQKYEVVRIDVFEGYRADLKLYCKRKE